MWEPIEPSDALHWSSEEKDMRTRLRGHSSAPEAWPRFGFGWPTNRGPSTHVPILSSRGITGILDPHAVHKRLPNLRLNTESVVPSRCFCSRAVT